jgi:hypothetical protein
MMPSLKVRKKQTSLRAGGARNSPDKDVFAPAARPDSRRRGFFNRCNLSSAQRKPKASPLFFPSDAVLYGFCFFCAIHLLKHIG